MADFDLLISNIRKAIRKLKKSSVAKEQFKNFQLINEIPERTLIKVMRACIFKKWISF